MNGRPKKRQLVLEPLAQRVLLAADVMNPAQETLGPENHDLVDVEGDIDACSTEEVNGLDETYCGTPSTGREVQLESGDLFILGSHHTGRLVRSNGSHVAFHDVEMMNDPNDYDCSPTGCGSTLMGWTVPHGKEYLGVFRTNVKDLGNGRTSFNRIELYGVATHDPCDVNNDGYLSPRDVLLIVNEFNAHGFRQVGGERAEGDTRVDVNGDGWVSPIDLLLVINALNRQPEQRSIPEWFQVPSEPHFAVTPEPEVSINVDKPVLPSDPNLLANDNAHSESPVLLTRLSGGDAVAAPPYVPLLSDATSLVAVGSAAEAAGRTVQDNDSLRLLGSLPCHDER